MKNTSNGVGAGRRSDKVYRHARHRVIKANRVPLKIFLTLSISRDRNFRYFLIFYTVLPSMRSIVINVLRLTEQRADDVSLCRVIQLT